MPFVDRAEPEPSLDLAQLEAGLDQTRAALAQENALLRKKPTAASVPVAAGASPSDPRWKKELTFELEFEDSRGKTWTGTFTTKILNIAGKQDAAIQRARFLKGYPEGVFEADYLALASIIAHLYQSLKAAPDWAKDEALWELEDEGVIFAIWEKVADHAAYYFRRGSYTPKGKAPKA